MYAIVLSGGAGSRLWPLSRESHPKPFMHLSGSSSLLQQTYQRALRIPLVDNLVTVTNTELFFKTKDELDTLAPELHNTIDVAYLLEPVAKNTAAAIAAAAIFALEQDSADKNLLVLPADHVVTDLDAFEEAVIAAYRLAEQNKLVLFGITPDHAATGYGYLCIEDSRVSAFIEKPDASKAEELIQAQNYFWNSGMLCANAQVIVDEMRQHCPEILDAAYASIANAKRTQRHDCTQIVLSAPELEAAPALSFDYAVLERSADIAAVSCNIGWNDVGSYTTLEQLQEQDPNQNRIAAKAITQDCENCFISSDDRLVAAIGLENLLIIDTSDALLVANKAHSQEIKAIYQELKKQEHPAYKTHRTVYRPWGSYTELETGERFKIKKIEVKPGASLSLQLHHHRSEHWIVVRGTAEVVNGENTMLVHSNESTYIKSGVKHRLSNPGLLPLVLIEVQCGDYLGEDDIVRFDDIYGRKTTPPSEETL